MPYTIQVASISLYDQPREGADGAVLYLLLAPCQDNPCTHVCRSHPGMEHRYELQPFARGGNRTRPGATPEQIANDEANIWGWDGNASSPTLTPSFLASEVNKQGATIRPYRAHWFLRSGRLDLCSDSTVTLHPNPVPCVLDPD
jgi:hypothetical protein